MPTRDPARPTRPASSARAAGSKAPVRPRPAPVRIPARRTVGDVFAGLGALVALVGLVGGVPYLLLRFVGPPLSGELLDLDLLTSRVGPSTIVAVLVLLVWLAWFQLFVCVIVEVYAGVRRVGMPARVPFSGGTQALANRLVSAVLVLFTATAVAAPIARMGTAPPVRAPMTAVAFSAPIVEQVLDTHKTKKVYVVQPPHGRHHESLWEIAEKCLGDGRRYPEIYRLNQHKEQPDGTRLRMADLIRPGWVLDMPDDARNVHVVPAAQARAQTLKEHPTSGHRPVGAHQESSAHQEVGAPLEADPPVGTRAEPTAQPTQERQGTQPQAGQPQQTDGKPQQGAKDAEQDKRGQETAKPKSTEQQAEEATQAEDRSPGLDLVDYLAGGSLAAAGLLLVLARRRREQLWRRAFGHRLVRPRDDAAKAEVALRLGADAPGARLLDVGLRMLGAELAKQDRTPPTVYAAHLSPRHLDLWIHPPDPDPPTPWTDQDGGQVWRLAAHEGRLLGEESHGAPYPGLVSLGTDASGRVLVDLEAAQGLINIRGPQTTAALAALAVELATNRWSDRMRITLVGFGEELTAIAPDRIKAVGSLAEVLPELEATAAPREEVLTGRVNGSPRDAQYLLSAVAPTQDEARRLALLARKDTAGYVVTGEVPHATWTVEITEDGKARIAELGFEVAAQLLPRRHYRALIELFRTAEQLDGEAIPDDEPLESTRPPAIEIRTLGPIEVVGAEVLEEGRQALATELLIYLATHPGGVHPVVLGGVLWPRGVQAMVRDATIARVADWLGEDGDGNPHLYADEAGRLRLGPEVRTDWALFRELVRRSHGDGTARAVLLERALGLVRGPLLSGRPPGRYAWLAADELEYDVAAGVADAAHRLCEIKLVHGDPDGAVAAIRAALLLAADDEGLWRDLLRATHATGDTARLRAVADGLSRRSASHPYGGGMAPETEALIDELLPSWRIHVVRESTA
ncbi:BTAD domain-containing putative transcriptional regulator [Nonomuraea sediminis]|uniref:BTAD domain-containing putative transcriptional regulator n=1 Tax=Nonomuraea sediminis TaxID=2835864 RepID=UPI001BDC3DFD|nr:BTAD domain-containing putative transcriptional regulator [Nonomuraea sediminis]